ncbi:hypothetical protein CIL03_08485 [Virgibacillus indicus]|uniref:Uncharacterized protein n=1 Tax=Virgibacillus indicus TaxID=2024554 RepID=A0A265NC54_9BACI|nr:hypothetical protein [Virgibacillus indicus]OZU89044.1 hypothetical protein CIL03_08485 [Virgibacillus indicus]
MSSPFSLSNDWQLNWRRIPSNLNRPAYINGESPKENKALKALAAVGIIGGRQLSRLFALDKKRLRKMVREQKLVRHEMTLDKMIIPIYSLGTVGAIIADAHGFKINYWVEYRIQDVLKRILFFELYHHFPDSAIIPAPEPFIGVMKYKKNPLFVYVTRGDINDLLMFLKWQNKSFSDRIIVITESLKHLQSLKVHIKNKKIRMTTDEELLHKKCSIQNLFYFLDDNGEFVKEA